MTQQTHMLDGRAVELRVVPFSVLLAARKFVDDKGEPDGEKATILMLVHSAHWADSGERVFRSVDDVMNWPASSAMQLFTLITEAAAVNRPKATATNGAQPPGNGAPQPDGDGAAPSH